MMNDDMGLVRTYALENSQEAFSKLVVRHIDLVYSVSLRQVRNSHLAEEVAQTVFIILARKAGSLGPKTILSAWLCRTAVNVAANALKLQQRRLRYELEASMQFTLHDSEPETLVLIAPHLDKALVGLGEKDHSAIVLRFFEGKSFREVGLAMGGSEESAKKRVARAVDRLRNYFVKHGIALSVASITTALSTHCVQAAPLHLTTTVLSLGATKGTAVSASTSLLIKSSLKFMAWTKAKSAVITALGVLLAAGATSVVITKVNPVSSKTSPLDTYLQDPELTSITNAPPMVAMQPTHFAKSNFRLLGKPYEDREIGRNISLETAILKAYRYPLHHIIFPEDLSQIRVDYLISVPERPRERFQAEIKRQFGWAAHVETREMDVYLLRVKNPQAEGIKVAEELPSDEWYAKHQVQNGMGLHQRMGVHQQTMTNFIETFFEFLMEKPVIDETGMTGKYDFFWKSIDYDPNPDHRRQMILEQFGLELVPARRAIPMLIVERAKK